MKGFLHHGPTVCIADGTKEFTVFLYEGGIFLPKISPMLVLKLAFFHGWDCNDSRRGLSQFGQDSEMRNRCFFMRDWRVDIRAREWNIPYWRVTDRSVTYEDLFCVTWSRPLADVRGHV